MCEKCLEVSKAHYGHLPDDELTFLLWNATAYPFCEPEYLEQQLVELKANTDGTLAGAVDYAYRKMDEAMKAIQEK